ncbi:cysteine--1-D-myo-inosityl 2-amino-2-deoxy-alpha-D-glucopyranoside ligase [Cryptosporangium phraense]|uniref:L-cysteine:1D-myo-inositol 2-amino-2-deoxy-alpha-D-glucopyranoside ligase n=1 Tax=Cryptosporangium phraense TaxID=2593070 RepID=A0A545AGM1_9ACTN|nr:cysteine--1-D-myo-inosityl 2-amino-2-deoxy-alpha-D-glucopyranoside ligase [Cryptosporangium phraense]TQS40472.1 cysteine--1-D-myo-inosityl 2-amino-2-deoxy-alpha-D-glucopyranoside ligase [Cryptosporangium phraense]
MQSWPHPDVPLLPGTGIPLRLYDSATREVRPTAPGPTARMYVCGITPYDATHLGHAATYLAFDLVNRVWRDGGHDVAYVQNVTDVDDPLFERADRDGEDWVVLGMRETALFREDMTALRVIPPAHYVGVVEAVEEIAELVEKLVSLGVAYRLEDGSGDVYQDISSADRFGYESGYDDATMLRFFSERGGDPSRPGKRNALDPLIWRGAREGEPRWPSPVGPGRPGWHVECAAIAVNRLGLEIDVQGGGSDLIFPHHEMSALHAEAAADQFPFARHYVHAGMIGLDGEKMSKSRGNLVFVSRLRGDRVDPMAIRLGLFSGHYRSDRAWTSSVLEEAQERLGRWRDGVSRPTGPSGAELLAAVRERLSDDLDTVGALRAVDEWASSDGSDPAAPALARATVDALLGIAL